MLWDSYLSFNYYNTLITRIRCISTLVLYIILICYLESQKTKQKIMNKTRSTVTNSGASVEHQLGLMSRRKDKGREIPLRTRA